jgi:fucose permease
MRIDRVTLRLALSFLAFISLGLPDGLLGVAWPSIRSYFGLSYDSLGPFLAVATTAYVVSSFSTGRILSRIGVGTLLALSCLATAASLLGYAIAPRWWHMVSLASLAGLGAGAIDAGLNTYVATHHAARALNWLHACWGIGTATGPMIMGAVLTAGRPWQSGYAIVGGAQVVLALCFALSRHLWPSDESAGADADIAAAPMRATLRLPVIWLNLAAFFVYTGLEWSFGAWTYSLLTEGRGVAMQTAAAWVSVFWSSLTIGRIIFGFLVAGRVSVDAMLRGCIVGIVIGAALVWTDVTPSLTFVGLALAGAACGPVFPSLMAMTPARAGAAHTANAVGFQVATAALGQSLLPGLVGVAARARGLEVIGPLLFAAALALLALHAALARSETRGVRDPTAAAA